MNYGNASGRIEVDNMDTSRRRWVLPLLLVGVLAGVLAVRVWQPGSTLVESNEAKPIEMSSRQLVELTIDNGEGKPQASLLCPSTKNVPTTLTVNALDLRC